MKMNYALFVQANHPVYTVSDTIGWFVRERFETLEEAQKAAELMSRDATEPRKSLVFTIYRLTPDLVGKYEDGPLWEDAILYENV
jgi:hypothetical protein